jgi:hypothetical protein
VPVLQAMPVERVRRAASDISERDAVAIRAGRVPHAKRQVALAWEAVMYAQDRMAAAYQLTEQISQELREACQARGRMLPEGLALLVQYATIRPIDRHTRQCLICGATFAAKSDRARYCSARCRQRARRMR